MTDEDEIRAAVSIKPRQAIASRPTDRAFARKSVERGARDLAPSEELD